MAYAIELTAMPEQAIVYLGGRAPISALRGRIVTLTAAVREAGLLPAGPAMARYFEEEFDPQDCDYEVDIPICQDQDGSFPDRVGEHRTDLIPAHHALVTEHVGPYAGLHLAFAALTEELNALGYAVAGPMTEVYVRGPGETADPAEYVTELHLPIAR